jgi:hypothetical protein
VSFVFGSGSAGLRALHDDGPSDVQTCLAHDAGDMLVDALVENRLPWHQPETDAVIDHGEAAACELGRADKHAADIFAGVCIEILNSGVVVMKSAKDGARIDDTGPLNRARDRRILVQ